LLRQIQKLSGKIWKTLEKTFFILQVSENKGELGQKNYLMFD